MPIDYSLVICTYNPDERLLERCLTAIGRLEATQICYEVILVDNNSAIPVREISCVREQLNSIGNLHIIDEPKQGVGFARIAAILQSAGEYIVYIDYDNEPAGNYLQELKKLNKTYPLVAAWGPGHVRVDFIDGIDPAIEQHARRAFQEKHALHTTYANVREWQSFYPFGTGLCTKASLLKEYAELAKKGKYTMPGRTGQQLSGGEDTQMVLHCIREGYAAGMSPSLCLQHMIPGSRANIDYLKRLEYYTALDYQGCLLEVFPEQEQKVKNMQLGKVRFARKVLKRFLQLQLSTDTDALFKLIGFIAFHAGIYKATGTPLPSVVNRIIKKLKAG